jgi:RsmE family RNA methyltransferase
MTTLFFYEERSTMNLILFEEQEITKELPVDDPRAVHIISVLRCGPGDNFDAGLVNGPRGKGVIRSLSPLSLTIDFIFPEHGIKETLYPVTVAAGLPRPQTARKMLREVTSLGVSALYFTGTEKGEASYRKSRLWTGGEVRKHLIAGAEQAFSTLLPEIRLFDTLDECLAELPEGEKIALDNYEAVVSLADYTFTRSWSTLLIGPEKGWSPGERDLLREHGYILAGLGTRVLRSETAAVAGVTLVLAGMHLLS